MSTVGGLWVWGLEVARCHLMPGLLVIQTNSAQLEKERRTQTRRKVLQHPVFHPQRRVKRRKWETSWIRPVERSHKKCQRLAGSASCCSHQYDEVMMSVHFLGRSTRARAKDFILCWERNICDTRCYRLTRFVMFHLKYSRQMQGFSNVFCMVCLYWFWLGLF